MHKTFSIFFLFFILNQTISAQETKIQKLDEIVLKTGRIDLLFRENSRSVKVISAEELKKMPARTLTDILQNFNGVDIRRRGADGMQADLYIRGGSFEQTLVLVDGFKTENPQSGHHTMNMMIPVENIKRIEVIKGPAARIYGQNAFTGAINIVTKNKVRNAVKGKIGYGSYNTKNFELTGSVKGKHSTHQLHYSKNTSEGYRYNTDFKNQNIFYKSRFSTSKNNYTILATFMERKFGANGFYASPQFKDQYEETQSSLIGITSSYQFKDLKIIPRIYWKRGQDMYEFVRGKPEIYRNLHITNKVGGSADMSYRSDWGETGFGVELAKVFITSNNLGDHERMMFTGFLEHRFLFFNEKADVTPGLAITYFSDFGFKAFPGIDLGYQLNKKVRVFGNLGYTYRIPTYTDLYYESPTTLGNIDLQPERAFSGELGLRFLEKQWQTDLVIFNRNAYDLIDYVKDNEDDRWRAENIQNVNTTGIETSVKYSFNINGFGQKINMGYTFLNDDLEKNNYNFSKYSLNSIKHQFVVGLDSQFVSFLTQTLAYRFVKRTDDYSYQVFDLRLTAKYRAFKLSASFSNLFDEEYTETSLVPMPGRNVMLQLSYTFK